MFQEFRIETLKIKEKTVFYILVILRSMQDSENSFTNPNDQTDSMYTHTRWPTLKWSATKLPFLEKIYKHDSN